MRDVGGMPVETNHEICAKRLMGDPAYGAAENLGYLVEEKYWDFTKRMAHLTW
jgi:hypothetical protein